MQSNTTGRYDPLSRALHWITALAVLVAFVLGPEHFGRAMRQGMDPATHWDIVLHESLGLLVFGLTAVRLLWLLLRPAPPQFAMPAWMQRLARLVQGVLWLLLLVLPLSALLALGSEGHPLTLLGGVRIDQLPWIAALPIAGWADWGELHGLLGDLLLWLAGAHAAAAIFHHVVRKDGVLNSMR